MIIIPDFFIFLETPRTGSKSCRDFLNDVPGAILSDECHVGCDVALAAKWATGLPLVTVTRDPLDHLASWYLACANKKKSFVGFIEKGLPLGALAKRAGFDPFILNPYRDIADKVYRLENGLDTMFKDLWIQIHSDDEFPDLNTHDKTLVNKNSQALFASWHCFSKDYAWLSSLES